MATTFNSIDYPLEKISNKSQGSSNKHGHLPTSRLGSINFSTEGSVCSLTFKHGKFKKTSEIKSPYLKDSVQMLSRVTEKRYNGKNGPNIISTYPFGTNIYKANSDEFNVTKKNKKAQKSVLTLPNEPAPLPESCTVSDMNDSEYFKKGENRVKGKLRPAASLKRKCRTQCKKLEFYDRDAQYCSQFNLDCSSAETVKKFGGDGNRKSKSVARYNGTAADRNSNTHDVWAVLRNINRFQFTPSPPMSEDSFIAPKKTKCRRRCNNRKDMRIFETCCTEEIAYISSYEFDKSSRCNLSHSSSIDKITVIDKQHDFDRFCTEFEESEIKEKKEKVKPKAIKKRLSKNKSPAVKSKTNYKTKACTKLKSQCDGLCDNSPIICTNYKDLKKMIATNKTVDQNHAFSTNERGNLEIDIPFLRPNNQYNASVDSENSGTSKAAASYKHSTNETKSAHHLNEQNLEEDMIHSDLDKSDEQISGITRVVLNKAQDVTYPKIVDSAKTNSNEIFSPSTKHSYKPKLTKTALHRQINKFKFPLVILGKNQLSSTIKVINQEYSQFDGLDKHIWPFMLNWYRDKHTGCELKTPTKTFDFNALKKTDNCDEVEKKIITKYKYNGPRQSTLSDKTSKEDYKLTAVPTSDYLNQSLDQGKSKPIRQFRDKMIKLLCKNTSAVNVIDGSLDPAIKENITVKVDSCTNVLENPSAKKVPVTVVGKKEPKIISLREKRPWAKAKRASDFIDSIIEKIKSGAYYTHGNVFNRKSVKEPEHTAQACEVPIDESTSYAEKPTSNADDLINYDVELINSITIPGFDEALPALEIKTMNMNEISVKHCMTNVMVYFDVIAPTVPTVNMNNPCDLLPFDITKNETRVFKCQTSILNAMLPSELCSILPKMMHNIAKLGEQLKVFPVLLDKTSDLSTKSEVTRCESPRNAISPLIHKPISKELWHLLNGRYFNSDKMLLKSHVPRRTSVVARYELSLTEGLAHKIATVRLFGYNKVSMMMRIEERILTSSVISKRQINTCTALQPYSEADRRIRYNPLSPKTSFDTTSFLNEIKVTCFKIISTIDSKTNKYILKIPNIITISMGNFKTDFFCNGFLNSWSSSTVISNIANPDNNIIALPNRIGKVNCLSFERDTSLQRCDVSVKNKKLRKKGFSRRYRKNKRISYASGEKVTLLSKIENLDDFSHALGSGKLLSGVFDGQSEQKIMSSIQEMKNWTTEISQRQALLVLLLTNKKDTSNLVRYRTVLLQGIALKRITKANELDMEIEVIERENLNGLCRFEGITYLPASVENQDNLFEELCWIAKTTASDYQRPFDESSEKLLKSLLEKRKKLNPSYLRVMARYVGLGLLKPLKPTKKK